MLIKADYYLLYCTKKEVRGKIIINVKRTSVDESGSRRFTVIMGARSNFFEVKKRRKRRRRKECDPKKCVQVCSRKKRREKMCESK